MMYANNVNDHHSQFSSHYRYEYEDDELPRYGDMKQANINYHDVYGQSYMQNDNMYVALNPLSYCQNEGIPPRLVYTGDAQAVDSHIDNVSDFLPETDYNIPEPEMLRNEHVVIKNPRFRNIFQSLFQPSSPQKHSKRTSSKQASRCYNDWDMLQPAYLPATRRMQPSVHPPNREVTLTDMCPFIAQALKSLGCTVDRKKQRSMRSRKLFYTTNAPKVETVCLECGHVVNQKPMQDSVLQDPRCLSHMCRYGHSSNKSLYPGMPLESGLGDITTSSPLNYGYGTPNYEWNKRKKEDPYSTWTYMEADHRRKKFEPLPQFEQAAPRIFETRSKKQLNRSLPRFDETSKSGDSEVSLSSSSEDQSSSGVSVSHSSC